MPKSEPFAYVDTFTNRLVWPGGIVTNSEGRMLPLYLQHHLPDELIDASEVLGLWLSAALEDPKVCREMKAAIHNWLEATRKVKL
jgi:hypothetical protein